MEIKNIRLKPCPFCGGKAKLFTVGCFHVFCDVCMSSGARYSTATRAIEAWNRRVILEEDEEEEIQENIEYVRY